MCCQLVARESLFTLPREERVLQRRWVVWPASGEAGADKQAWGMAGGGRGSRRQGRAGSTLGFGDPKVDEQAPPRPTEGVFWGWLGVACSVWDLLSRVLGTGHRTWVWGVVWGLIASSPGYLVRPQSPPGKWGHRKREASGAWWWPAKGRIQVQG